MAKLDFKKELKEFYGATSKKVSFVDVPPMNYLLVDGFGGPAHPDFSSAVEALFALAYTIKFTIKKRDGGDYGVMPLEGLWWSEDMNSFITRDKSQWNWIGSREMPVSFSSLLKISAAAPSLKRALASRFSSVLLF